MLLRSKVKDECSCEWERQTDRQRQTERYEGFNRFSHCDWWYFVMLQNKKQQHDRPARDRRLASASRTIALVDGALPREKPFDFGEGVPDFSMSTIFFPNGMTAIFSIARPASIIFSQKKMQGKRFLNNKVCKVHKCAGLNSSPKSDWYLYHNFYYRLQANTAKYW